ncbi:MAG: SulP family inorganic anion transporter [Eubacterium sp.]|nr:SulP family inorganic anion transporter [Eubacterium sp.]
MLRMKKDFPHIGHDLLIGVLIAAISIPISMGYANVAGLPAIYGLYGSFLPILVYGLLTSSPRFVFGVDAAPAALTGALLSTLGITAGTEDAIRIMPLITLLVALWLFLFFILKANRLLKFISQPVMGGFITGIGITIILMQLPKLFGGTAGSGEIVELVIHICEQAETVFHWPSLILGLATILIILLSRHFFPKLPMQAIVMVLGALLQAFTPLGNLGISCLPSVDSGLPKPVLPDFSMIKANPETLLLSTLTIAIVILSETLLASNSYALKYNETLHPRREILGYSLGNAAASLAGCCPVNGSISRSGIADQFGVRSQWMSVSASMTMGLILLFGTGFISLLPVPVLTAIVISALIGTLEVPLARRLKKVDKAEYIIFWAALLAVLLMGTVYGVLIGVLLSSITFIVRQSRPKIEILGVDPEEEGYHSLARSEHYAPIKNVLLYRFSGALFFANIDYFEEGLNAAVKPDTRVIVVDSAGINSVDVTASERLLQMYYRFKDKGISFYLAGHVSGVNAELRAFGAKELIRKGVVRSRITLALKDAGYEKPFILEEREHINKPVSKHLSEMTWAYGDEADSDHDDDS